MSLLNRASEKNISKYIEFRIKKIIVTLYLDCWLTFKCLGFFEKIPEMTKIERPNCTLKDFEYTKNTG